MLPLGVRFVQLRVKDQPEDLVRKEIIRARDLCRSAGATLVVNDYWQIAIEEGCDWLHLGQEDLDLADMKAIRAAGLRIGLSTHDREELERALSFAPDYIALGPIWPTILKKMKWHQQGPTKLTEWKAQIGDIPLVAIGGLRLDRAAEAFACGADIVSVVTDICLHNDPESQVGKWIEVTA